MSAFPYSLELQLRCQNSDAVVSLVHAIRMCCEGFRLQIDRAARENRLAPAVVFGPFVALAIFTLLFSFRAQSTPMLECFIGMIAWVVLFYGLSGQMRWEQARSASLLQSSRINAWLAMLSTFMLSVRDIVEQRIRVMVAMLALILNRLRACLRIRLGLTDVNLTTFRLVPPESVHA